MTDNGNNIGSAEASLDLDASGFLGSAADIQEQLGHVQEYIEKTLGAVDDLGDSLESNAERGADSLGKITDAIDTVNDTLGKISLGAFDVEAIQAAQSVKQIEGQFRVLTGSQEKATQDLADLKKQAELAGTPFMDLAQSMGAMLPFLKDSNVEIGKVADVAQRLSLINPGAGVEGGANALRLSLAGIDRALRRYGISADEMKALRDEANGSTEVLIDGLDKLLNKKGLTEQALQDMGQTGIYAFGELADEVKMTIASAFTPFLNDVLLPIVQGFDDMLKKVQELNPEILTLGGGIAALAGISGISSLIPGLGPVAAPVLATAGAAVVGVTAGTDIVKAIADAGGTGGDEESYKGKSNAEIDASLLNRAKQALFDIITLVMATITGFTDALTTGVDTINKSFELIGLAFKVGEDKLSHGFADFTVGIGTVLKTIGDALPFGAGANISSAGSLLTAAGLATGRTAQADEDSDTRKLRSASANIDNLSDGALAEIASHQKSQDDILKGIYNILFPAASAAASGTPATPSADTGPAEDPNAPNSKQVKAFGAFNEQLTAIRSEYHDKEVAEDNSHYQKLIDLKATSNKKIDQLNADELAAHDAAVVQENQQIQRLQLQDSRKQQDEFAALQDKKQGIQEQANVAEVQREQDHQRALEDLDKAHKLRLMDAAASLDAFAVLKEQESYRTSRDQSNETFSTAQQRAKDQVVAQLKAADDGYTKQRAADALNQERAMEDLQTNFDEQEKLRQDNLQKAIDKEKQAELDQETLENNAHITRMNTINSEENQKESLLRSKFIDQWNSLASSEATKLGIQKAGQSQMEDEARAWWSRMQGIMGTASAPVGLTPQSTNQQTIDYYKNLAKANNANAAPVNANYVAPLASHYVQLPNGRNFDLGSMNIEYDQNANIHAGEIIITPALSNAVRTMLGPNATQNDLVNAVSRGAVSGQGGGGGSPIYHINNPAIVLPGDIGNYSPDQIKSFAAEAVIELTKAAAAQFGGVSH